MGYDTEHVRNVGDTPKTITDIATFTELLANTALASIYTVIRHSAPATGPELTETTTVPEKTVYEYLDKLAQAGLITEVGTDGGASAYAAGDFALTLTVRDTSVSITPELIEVVAYADEYPVINRVLNDHGVVTFVLAYDLITAHTEGDITVRQIATRSGLSSGTAYDLLEALYEIRDFGDAETSPTTYTPDDATGDTGTLREELLDE